MAKNAHKDFLEQVEDYSISDIVIRNSVGDRLNIPIGIISVYFYSREKDIFLGFFLRL